MTVCCYTVLTMVDSSAGEECSELPAAAGLRCAGWLDKPCGIAGVGALPTLIGGMGGRGGICSPPGKFKFMFMFIFMFKCGGSAMGIICWCW